MCIFALRCTAGIAQLVERNLAKVDVAGSNPVSRSVPWQWDRERRQSRRNSRFTSSCEMPRRPPSHQAAGSFLGGSMRRRSQVAKAEVCKTSMHRFESDRRLLHAPISDGRVLFGLLAGVAELVDAKDLKSFGPQGPCGFKSRPRYSVFHCVSPAAFVYYESMGG
jgi:hypothetical protein